MTEIGLAQKRLLDDSSSAGQNLPPSTTTAYSSEISQPGSYPAIENDQYQPADELQGHYVVYSPRPQRASSDATQIIAPAQGPIYDYSTPATSTHIDSPFEGTSEHVTTYPSASHLTEATNLPTWRKAAQRSKSMQFTTYSPHDTEPLSSVPSPRLNRSKSDVGPLGLVSPQHSPSSTNDELSMPMVAVEIPSPIVKKKRGRPKKQSLLEDDDDELALPPVSESDEKSVADGRRPGRPLNVSAEPSGNPDYYQVFDGTTTEIEEGVDQENDIAASDNKLAPAVSTKPETREPRKKKVKRSKTASAVLHKPRELDVDDDVIWVDSRPLQIEESIENNQAKTPVHADTVKNDSQSPLTTNTEKYTPSVQNETQQAPKKRGRKRKETADQPVEPTQSIEDPEQPPNADGLASNTNSTENISELDLATEKDSGEARNGDTTPQLDSTTLVTNRNEPPLQTPRRNEASPELTTSESPRKELRKHSPIASTSSVPYRVGLSRRARIAPLLKVVRK